MNANLRDGCKKISFMYLEQELAYISKSYPFYPHAYAQSIRFPIPQGLPKKARPVTQVSPRSLAVPYKSRLFIIRSLIYLSHFCSAMLEARQ